MKLLWSPLALERVDEAFAFIATDDAAAARRWLEELLERVASLRRFPDSGCLVPELGRRDLRELLVGSYRIVYRRGENAVEVLTIRHQARELDAGELAT